MLNVEFVVSVEFETTFVTILAELNGLFNIVYELGVWRK